MPSSFGDVELDTNSPASSFGDHPVGGGEGNAQRLGNTKKGTIFGKVTKGREPGVEEIGLTGTGGELVRRTMNVPTQLVYGQEMFPQGQPILPAEGVTQLAAPVLNPMVPYIKPVVDNARRALGVLPTQSGVVELTGRGLHDLFPNVELFQGTTPPKDNVSEEAIRGFGTGLAKTGEQVVTPENAAILAGLVVAPEAGIPKATVSAGALSYFFPQMFGQTAQQVGQASVVLQDPSASPAEKGTAVGETVGSGLATLGLGLEGVGRGLDTQMPKSGLTYEEVGKAIRQSPKTIPGTKKFVMPAPEIKMMSGLGDYELFQNLEEQMRAAMKEGNFDKVSAIWKQREEIKNRQPIPGMPPVKPGDATTMKDLRPAVEVSPGRIIYGEQGETHADVLARNGIDPESIPHEDPRRGFTSVANPNTLITRMDAEKIAGVKGTAKAGGLDSQDLPGGQPMKGEQPNAIRELRTDRISETQSPGDLQKMGEEVREGAGEEGEVRGGQGEEDPLEYYSGLKLTKEQKRLAKETARAFYPLIQKVQEAFPRITRNAYGQLEDLSAKISPEERKQLIQKAINASTDSLGIQGQIETGRGELGKYVTNLSSKFRAVDHDTIVWPAISSWLTGQAENFKRLAKIREALSLTMSKGKESKFFSGLDPEELKRAIKAGRNFVSALREEGKPKFVYKIVKDEKGKPDIEEITDKYELGRAIEETGEVHHWMDSEGNLVQGKAPNNTHYLAAKKILRQGVTDPEASDMKAVYAKMREKGYAKVIEQDDAIYVVGDATGKQIQKAAELADKGGKDLYVKGHLYTTDPVEFIEEQAGGRLDDEELPSEDNYRDMYDPRNDNIDPGEFYYSGLPTFGTKDLVKSFVDVFKHVTGVGTGRKFPETMAYAFYKTARTTKPRTAAANEQIANKLIAITTLRETEKMKGTPAGLTKTMYKLMSQSLYDDYVKAGLGIKPGKGVTIPKNFKATAINRKPIFVRTDLVPDIEQTFNPVSRVEDVTAITAAMNAAVHSQIFGGMDLVYHAANELSAILTSSGKSPSTLYDALLNVYGVNAVDTLFRLIKPTYEVLIKDPAIKPELERLSEIGALRTTVKDASLFNKPIQVIDKIGRLTLSRMYDNLVKQGVVKDTPLDRREFVNKMGQYKAELMSRHQSIARTYASQFVVAGKTFNYNALNYLFMRNPARSINPEAYLKMKTVRAVSFVSALITAPIALNLMMNGTPFGRKGTRFGVVDMGTDDPKTGRHNEFDVWQAVLARRAFRNIGGEAFARDMEKGDKKPMEIGADMFMDVMRGWMRPWMGPPARMIDTALTGRTFEGFKVSKDTDSNLENLKAAASQVNPSLSALLEGQTEGTGGLKKLKERLVAPIGFKQGKFPTHEELLQKETGKSPEKMDMEDRFFSEVEHEDKVKAERTKQPIALREAEELQAQQKAAKNIQKRGIELRDSLSKGDKQWLESRGLLLKGYDNKIVLEGQKIYLTENEMARYTELMKQNVTEAIGLLREDYDSMDDPRMKEEAFSEAMTAARESARDQLLDEIDSKRVPKKKKKRFSIFRQEPEEGEPDVQTTR